LGFFEGNGHLALYPFRAESVDTDDHQKMAGGSNAAFDSLVEVIPANQLARIDPREFAMEFKNFTQFFDNIVVFRRVRYENMLAHLVKSLLWK